MLDLSIVIPTLNEEDYIGVLLDSILNQTKLPKEVIVVDAFSEDKTIEEIKKRQRKNTLSIKNFQIPKQTISRQRNLGVVKSASNNILFLDADMELKDKKTLEIFMKQIFKDKVDIAVSDNWPNSRYWKDLVYFFGENSVIRGLKSIWPSGTSRNMYVFKPSFEKVGGFDEEVAVGEDMDLIQRMVKKGLIFKIFSRPKFYTSVRRLHKDGHSKHALKMMKSFLYVNKNGFRGNPIDYEFGKFKS